MGLNEKARRICDQSAEQAKELRIEVIQSPEGARLLDFGVKAQGSIEAGLELAKICMGGMGVAELVPSHLQGWDGPAIQVRTNHPVAACLASQYAGWKIQGTKFFAMGSGPMRACYAKEEIFNTVGGKETPGFAVGVLETGTLPGAEVIAQLGEKLQLAPEKITLCLAATSSVAGAVQIAARSVETALHKLHELGFPVHTIQEGTGWAPLPPPTPDFIQAIGRTNDAILFGGLVHLWVNCEDDLIGQIGSKAPSNQSGDYGAPFGEVFSRAGGDFYKIDPLLFSPARVVFNNLKTGKVFAFGELNPQLLRKSWPW
ncbi:MAG: methenyltetrahydromethanopterin cyclohydrolase [Gemmataceae bacterium]|nr:methenyltetrahydromethanopterin cyclohydrolase [Gemmataceae bacterium]